MTAAPFWVFGFGSLIWAPGFPYIERRPARLMGWHRAFSLISTESWGSERSPGLIVTLQRGGHCDGIAYGVARRDWPSVVDYLRRREQAYHHVSLPVVCRSGTVRALTFVCNPNHQRWVGKMAPKEAARLILQGAGSKGTSFNYFSNILAELIKSNRSVPTGMRALQQAICAEIGAYSPLRSRRP